MSRHASYALVSFLELLQEERVIVYPCGELSGIQEYEGKDLGLKLRVRSMKGKI